MRDGKKDFRENKILWEELNRLKSHQKASHIKHLLPSALFRYRFHSFSHIYVNNFSFLWFKDTLWHVLLRDTLFIFTRLLTSHISQQSNSPKKNRKDYFEP